MPAHTQQKSVLYWGIGALVATLLIGKAIRAYNQAQVTPPPPPPTGHAGPLGGAQPETVARKVVPTTVFTYGTFTVTTGELIGFEVRPDLGEAFEVSPVTNVSYDWYVNGEFFRRISGPDGSSPVRLRTPDIRTTEYRLVPGQGIEQVKFAYVRYKGPKPPEGWYGKALGSGE